MSHPYDMGDKKQVSILGPTLKFKGELTANEDLIIQGQIEGTINHTSKLTIGEEGKLKADVKAEHISVEGKVKGDLEGREAVVIKDNADVAGNIFSPTVNLYEGATFNGRIDMSGKTAADAKKPEKPAKKPDAAKSSAVSKNAANDDAKDEAPKKQTASGA